MVTTMTIPGSERQFTFKGLMHRWPEVSLGSLFPLGFPFSYFFTGIFTSSTYTIRLFLLYIWGSLGERICHSIDPSTNLILFLFRQHYEFWLVAHTEVGRGKPKTKTIKKSPKNVNCCRLHWFFWKGWRRREKQSDFSKSDGWWSVAPHDKYNDGRDGDGEYIVLSKLKWNGRGSWENDGIRVLGWRAVGVFRGVVSSPSPRGCCARGMHEWWMCEHNATCPSSIDNRTCLSIHQPLAYSHSIEI